MTEANENLPVVAGNVVRSDDSVLGDRDREALARAVKALEHSNVATRLAATVGKQLSTFGRLVPAAVSGIVNRIAENAIKSALDVAVNSLANKRTRDSRLLHKAMAVGSGAIGGLFGLSSLAVELPVSTVIILRSIADIARSEGEDLSDPDAALACLEVFALGAREKDSNFVESGYFATRSLLAKTVSEASRFVLYNGLSEEAAPALVRLISQIGSRFGVVVSEKLAIQAMPIVGAAGGAAVNYAFIDHFQSLAFGHFTVRRLERLYGGEVVRAEYDKLLEAAGRSGYAQA